VGCPEQADVQPRCGPDGKRYSGHPLRGRATEVAASGARLDEDRSGVGSVILVEERGGLDKSRLLDACASMAAERSFRVGRGVAEPHRRAVELDVLFDALFGGRKPSSRATPSATCTPVRNRGSGSFRTSRR
jgi:hypothetical protein